MKHTFVLAMVTALCSCNIEVLAPESLRSRFNANGKAGSITYTVSTFGNIPYNEREPIELLAPQQGNEFGCRNLEKPKNASDIGKYAWLVERSECTYSKKSFIAQQSGAYVSIVFHNQPYVNVTEVIPCADSVCKLKRQQPEDTDHTDIQGRRSGTKGGLGCWHLRYPDRGDRHGELISLAPKQRSPIPNSGSRRHLWLRTIS